MLVVSYDRPVTRRDVRILRAQGNSYPMGSSLWIHSANHPKKIQYQNTVSGPNLRQREHIKLTDLRYPRLIDLEVVVVDLGPYSPGWDILTTMILTPRIRPSG